MFCVANLQVCPNVLSASGMPASEKQIVCVKLGYDVT